MALEYDTGQIYNINFKHIYYFPGATKLLMVPGKWSQDRGEDKLGREGTDLKLMGKCSICVWKKVKLQRTILHAPRCALPETSINQVQAGLIKFYSIFVEISKNHTRSTPPSSVWQKLMGRRGPCMIL